MTITLSLPVIVIILFVLVTQIWAWTRDGTPDVFSPSDRDFAVIFAMLLDIVFIAVIGGIWIW